MRPFDWMIFVGFLAYVVIDGLRRGRGQRTSEDYFLAGRGVRWWGVWLSIMATQASAITMVGTTGQGWLDGTRFVQFYFGLPIAMLILAYTAVPAYHRTGVTTAYEYLGRRFDAKTRTLSAVLFLVLRGLSVGFVIHAPALVLAKIFALPLGATVVATGGVAIAYTVVGGLGAVISTDVKQMIVMSVGLAVAFGCAIATLPDHVGFDGALTLARASGHLVLADTRWDPAEKYTIWSSLLGGLFLFLSYFGTDQSQAQRLLASRSMRDTRLALLLNGVFKIPFQLLVLLTGTLLFVHYLYAEPRVSFDPAEPSERSALVETERQTYDDTVTAYSEAQVAARAAAERVLEDPRDAASAAAFRDALDTARAERAAATDARGGGSDTNYVFLDFILGWMPVGLAGLLLAAIFAAALSSIDSELNAMATVAVVDVYQRIRPGSASIVAVSRMATLVVGTGATAFALYAGHMGSLIEAVNRVGSYVYGSLLGAFVLAWLVPRATGHGAFVGLLCGMLVVGVAAETDLAFLFLNAIGTVTVVVVGTLVSIATGARDGDATAS